MKPTTKAAFLTVQDRCHEPTVGISIFLIKETLLSPGKYGIPSVVFKQQKLFKPQDCFPSYSKTSLIFPTNKGSYHYPIQNILNQQIAVVLAETYYRRTFEPMLSLAILHK